ncbi:DUF4405 domain-containing protein [Candidatus Woesearchaeota archaeon]|nr:DUF4405 domain-containing protein [Candidatus Woesearchaeota archaeon]
MNKGIMNYIVDVLLGISFVITAVTGIIIFLFLPEGVRQGRYQVFLGITKGVWSGIHDYAGLVMIGLSLFHLALHWNWLVCMTKSCLKGKKKVR